jgi:hypothetical protein
MGLYVALLGNLTRRRRRGGSRNMYMVFIIIHFSSQVALDLAASLSNVLHCFNYDLLPVSCHYYSAQYILQPFKMGGKPSKPVMQWADSPFKLIESPRYKLGVRCLHHSVSFQLTTSEQRLLQRNRGVRMR